MTYAEKLKDPRWQRKRLEVFDLNGWACAYCGSKRGTLAVHHMRYVKGREPWQYQPWELRCVCESCHAELHYRQKEGITESYDARTERMAGDAANFAAFAEVMDDPCRPMHDEVKAAMVAAGVAR